MATRSVSCVDSNGGTLTWSWSGLLQSSTDNGDKVSVGNVNGLTAQMVGTLGTGGEVTLQGSNDGTTWGTLKDLSGNDLTLAAIGAFVAIPVRPLYIRPSVTGGDGTTSLGVILSATR